ncbi:hypothetical protein HK100_003136 [Physocladia obscura]|uniref:CASP C-terminal domain-containing protein n=1 Tax=Physocladia obscura TaxID=109957 RepID=A0AAD5SX99_9FUNG|nr:hypothetical protein HK100_003136 [Physocladia obscura]
MKQIEFPANEEETIDGGFLWDETPSSPNSGTFTEKSLEKLLIDKNKRLKFEVASLKDSLDSQSSELKHAKQDVEHYKLDSITQKSLISKLEEDVYNLNSIVAVGNADPKANSRSTDTLQSNDLLNVDPLMAINVRSSLSSQPELLPVLGSNLNAIAIPGVSPDSSSVFVPSLNVTNSSIVPILASQRDRYRQRNTELEEQAKSQNTFITDLKARMEQLKNDNMKLYEKLRYTESFPPSGQNSHSVVSMPSTSQILARRNNPSQDDVQSRYNTLYETTLDPFQRFHRNEQASRMQKLNPAEKAAFFFTTALVGSKYTRIGFVIYSVMLHCLVFVALYMLSQWEECRHDHVVSQPLNVH